MATHCSVHVHWMVSGQNQEVAHSWKFAAQDIFSVLTKVRNDGLLGECTCLLSVCTCLLLSVPVC